MIATVCFCMVVLLSMQQDNLLIPLKLRQSLFSAVHTGLPELQFTLTVY